MNEDFLVAVTLWVKKGEEASFAQFEQRSLAIAARHGGKLLYAARLSEAARGSEAPYEFHLLGFPSEAHYRAFVDDPARASLSSARAACVARTDVVSGPKLST